MIGSTEEFLQTFNMTIMQIDSYISNPCLNISNVAAALIVSHLLIYIL
jgi:hypothetical protein